MVHVRIVAAEFLIHRRRALRWWSNGTPSSQHNQEMGQSGAQHAPITLNRAGAVALQQMLIKKLGYQCFVDALQAQSATVYPLCEVANAAKAMRKRGRGVATVCQVQHVRINVRGERLFGEPIDAGMLG